MNKYKIVEVKWIDAQSSLDSITLSELSKSKLAITNSCGYLIHEDKEKIILGFMLFGVNWEGEDLIKHYQIIPKGMIKSIKQIKEIN